MVEGERKQPGLKFGLSRVLDPDPQFPVSAKSLDNRLPIYSNEVCIDVTALNIDAASFLQMEEETGHDKNKIAQIILENTRERGKQQNRVTGSGGMLLGTIRQVGSQYQGPVKLKPGDKVATLVSLSLTPLQLESISDINLKTHQVQCKGHAILCESSALGILPDDIPEMIAVAVFDVAGAPGWVNHLAKSDQTVVVLGAGGKAGVLTCLAAREKIGKKGRLIGLEPFAPAAEELKALQVCDEVLSVDATNAVVVQHTLEDATQGKLADLVVNVIPVPNTEMATLLCANNQGTILFYGMATSFTRVALGAEGISVFPTLLFGNGFYPGHTAYALSLLRKYPKVYSLFQKRYLSKN